MVRQVAVGKRIHSPGANEHRTRCCSGHPGMVQAAAPGACRPTENALMGFAAMSAARHLLQCGGPDTMRKTRHRLVFHHEIIHENKFAVVKKLLYPLHLRMQCSESTCFCNKRGFMRVFVKAVSPFARDAPGRGAQTAFPLTPADVCRVSPDSANTHSPAARMGRAAPHYLAISVAFVGAALPAFPSSSARIARASLLCLSFRGDRLETPVHAPRRWPTRRRACVERGTCRCLHLAGAAWPGIRPSRSA